MVHLSSKPEQQQADAPPQRQPQVRDEQRQEAQVPQEVLEEDSRVQLHTLPVSTHTRVRLCVGAYTNTATDLRGAHFVERHKDGGVQEPAEGQVRVEGPGGHQQQEELREERRQAQAGAPAAVWSNKLSSHHEHKRGAELLEYLRPGRARRSTERSCAWCLFWSDGRSRSRGESPNRTSKRRDVVTIDRSRYQRPPAVSEHHLQLVEERGEHQEHSAGHAPKQKQLSAEEASNNTSEAPPA